MDADHGSSRPARWAITTKPTSGHIRVENSDATPGYADVRTRGIGIRSALMAARLRAVHSGTHERGRGLGRDKIRANATHVLQPGEIVQAVIPAQATSAWLALISYWIILIRNSYRVIVATDRRVLVCRSGRFRMTPVKSVLRELPRTTRIGPPTGLWYRCDHLGERLYINKRFHKDILAADSAAPAGETAQVPAGWYPDPEGLTAQRYWNGMQWTDQTSQA